MYQPGEIATLRATVAVCQMSISLLVSTRQSTYTAKSRVVEAGLKLPDRAFSVLPARSLFSTWRPQHPRFTTFLLFPPFPVLPLFSLSFFITCFGLLVETFSAPTSSACNARVCARCAHAPVVIAHTTCTKQTRDPIEGETSDTWRFHRR